ncbi:MAG: hypothetical protein KF757_13670 [Phycisphaeraceae bacterium]|nr:hypothetical protein [Phycisphaeraceae bacterium]MCW5764011.1 hypothetical protein [Phycisphaeraceae bacterium]
MKLWARAMSLAETTIALAVVSVLLGASLNTVGATVTVRQMAEDQERAVLLAQDLMAEIMQVEYGNSGTNFSPFSPNGSTSRAAYTTIDHYHGWTSTPPITRDGKTIEWGWGLTRRVSVARGSSVLSGLVPSSKVIRVEVMRGKKLVFALDAIRVEAEASTRSMP